MTSSNLSNDFQIQFHLQDVRKHEGCFKKVFGVKFCHIYPSLYCYFASVGSNTISIFHIPNESDKAQLVQYYVDEDVSSSNENSEDYYTVTWATDIHDSPVVAAAGNRAIIKVVNLLTQECKALLGHGDAINELTTHPNESSLIFSASKDRSIRLWNLRTFTCVAIFAGEEGHKDEIITIDIHRLGNVFASGSMDTSIKLWSLKDPVLLHAIEKSNEVNTESNPPEIFPTVYQQWPIFSTTQIHCDYVDCVRWVGDFILSKATKNRAVLWAPDPSRYKVPDESMKIKYLV